MFIDTHAHIYVDQFTNDFINVINRAREAEVNQILMPNIDLSSITDVMDRFHQYPNICLPMVGLHPCSIDKDWKLSIQKLEKYLPDDSVKAVGECGIDLYWDTRFKQEQMDAFRYQVQWALDYDLPVVIHSRSAIDITIDIISDMQNGALRGVFHCFDQSPDHARQIMDLGFYMGIGGIITYKNNEELRRTISQIPIGSILLETDAPYLPPVPYRGKRNESSYIPIIANKLGEIQKIDLSEIGNITTQNATALFRL